MGTGHSSPNVIVLQHGYLHSFKCTQDDGSTKWIMLFLSTQRFRCIRTLGHMHKLGMYGIASIDHVQYTGPPPTSLKFTSDLDTNHWRLAITVGSESTTYRFDPEEISTRPKKRRRLPWRSKGKRISQLHKLPMDLIKSD
jgi:hypothetical protein